MTDPHPATDESDRGDPWPLDTAVPADETPAMECPYCGQPFRTERAGILHIGHAHPERQTPEEQQDYCAAREAEADELFIYHLKVVGALSVLYAMSVLGYMVVLGAG